MHSKATFPYLGYPKGIRIRARVEMICPEAPCELSFVFNTPPLNQQADGSFSLNLHTRLAFPSVGSPYFDNRSYGAGGNKFELSSAFIDFSSPKTINLYVTESDTLVIDIEEESRRICLKIGGSREFYHKSFPYAGLSWTSTEDDPGVSFIRIDSLDITPINYSGYIPFHCHSPAPPL